MKKITLTVAAGLLLFVNSAKAQLTEISFLNGGAHDAELLFKNYLDPWAKSIGNGLDAGWYNSAKPHGLFGFDVTLTTSFALAPGADKTYDLNNLAFANLKVNGTDGTAQTVAGSSDKGPVLDVYANDKKTKVGSFNAPQGTGLPGVPLPMVKIGFGLPFSTEIDARFLPNIKIGSSGNLGLWGVGLKHSVKQWIQVVSMVPFWDLSVVGAYSRFSTNSSVHFTPDDLGSSQIEYKGQASDFDGQKAYFDVNAWNVGLVIGTNLPIFNVYGGIGYTSSQATLKLKGNYYVGGNATINPLTQKVEVYKDDLTADPINLDFEKVSNIKYTAGMRVKMAVVTLHADYSYAEYSIFSAGLGISFR